MVAADRLTTNLTFEAEAHAILTSASAAKAYKAHRPIIQRTCIELAEGAIVEYLPDHLIPHADTTVIQTVDIRMARRSCAILYDALAAGRIGRAERWAFREILSEISINCGAERRYLNRTLISPPSCPLDELGWMEHYNYVASLVAVAESDRDWNQLAAKLADPLEGVDGP